MIKKFSVCSVSLWLIISSLFAACAAETPAGRPLATEPESAAAGAPAATAEIIETATEAVQTLATVQPSASPVPMSARPLLTAPVVELGPRTSHDVTPDPLEDQPAVVIEPPGARLQVMPGAYDQTTRPFTLSYKVNAPPSEVEAWYQQQMPASGWQLADHQESQPAGSGVQLGYTRANLYALVTITYNSQEQVTEVSLSLKES